MTQAPRRKKDSAATKEALLRAASELFAERGFSATTVRDVAARAGVNQALLFRYFGSKSELFAAVLAGNSVRMLSELPAEELPRQLLAHLLTAEETSVEHPIVAMLRSWSDERAAEILRSEISTRYTARLAELSEAPDAELRADLVLAWMFGIGMVRSVLGKSPLAEADPEQITRYVSRATAALLQRADHSDDR